MIRGKECLEYLQAAMNWSMSIIIACISIYLTTFSPLANSWEVRLSNVIDIEL